MKKYSGILICSDLDGTLRDSKGEFSKENIDAINYFCENGGLFTLCTGRNYNHINEIRKMGLNINTYLICFNGAMIYDFDKKEIVYENPLIKEDFSNIDEFLKENEQIINDVNYHSIEIENSYSAIKGALYKIGIITYTAEESAILRKKVNLKYPGYFLTNSWDKELEILDKNSTKGQAVKKMRELLGESVKTVICVGNYENDIPMLKEADISYAVANAIDIVKECADRITVTNNESAIAKIIEEIK